MQPTVIQGPAYVVRGAHKVYTTGAVTVKYVRRTWNPKGAITGSLGPRVASTHIEVSCTPVGHAADLANYWPYGPSDIGASIFGGSATPLSVVPLTGNKVTFPRSAVLRMPSLDLRPTRTAFDDMQWICLGDPAMEPTNAAYFQALAAVGGGEGAADTSFDETKIISPRYTAAWGAAPFDALEAEDGFRVQYVAGMKEMVVANYGLINVILDDLNLTAGFTPVNLTEANYATLLKLQDAAALRPGDIVAIASDARDLVISGTGLATLTLKNMGAIDGGMRYDAAVFRQDAVTMGCRRTWAAGVEQVMFTLA